jgi:hypothetical protein
MNQAWFQYKILPPQAAKYFLHTPVLTPVGLKDSLCNTAYTINHRYRATTKIGGIRQGHRYGRTNRPAHPAH